MYLRNNIWTWTDETVHCCHAADVFFSIPFAIVSNSFLGRCIAAFSLWAKPPPHSYFLTSCIFSFCSFAAFSMYFHCSQHGAFLRLHWHRHYHCCRRRRYRRCRQPVDQTIIITSNGSWSSMSDSKNNWTKLSCVSSGRRSGFCVAHAHDASLLVRRVENEWMWDREGVKCNGFFCCCLRLHLTMPSVIFGRQSTKWNREKDRNAFVMSPDGRREMEPTGAPSSSKKNQMNKNSLTKNKSKSRHQPDKSYAQHD